ncbi:hypothetical protein [Thermus caliditerrae]|uniref:hypothetical protein n=1 Tax=Thermus caliditerrae TaxID=1330700 RepID=UPI00057075B8|nr:hypothetical protein [Thermus caliditerrae]
MKKTAFWVLGILFWALSACTPPVGEVQEVEVTFKVTNVPAEYTKVYLAGDFTNWDGDALEMSPVPGESGSFTVKAKIAKESRIHYKYVGSTGVFAWAGAESFPRGINRSSFITDEGGGKASIVNEWNVQGRADKPEVEVSKIRLEATPPPGVSDTVHVAGVMNDWTHEAMTLEGGKWVKEIALDTPLSVKPDAAIAVNLADYSPWLEYKYTKGSWETVEEETPPTGQGDGNRIAYAYKVQGGVLLMEDTIKRFK